MLKPTTAPVQKLLTKVPFFGAGLHDAVSVYQQSGVARENIPGVPISKTTENNLRKEQTLPKNDSKYFVHAAGLWNMDAVNIPTDIGQAPVAHPRVDTHPKNATQNITHTSVNKGEEINVSYMIRWFVINWELPDIQALFFLIMQISVQCFSLSHGTLRFPFVVRCCFIGNGKEMYHNVKRTCRDSFFAVISVVVAKASSLLIPMHAHLVRSDLDFQLDQSD